IDAVGSWHGLFSTGFGELVLLKIGLLAVLAVLGAVNRYRSVPRADRRVMPLAGIGAAELVVGGVVLVATGFLQNLAPASTAAAASARPAALKPLVVTATDFATTARVRLTLTP